MKNEILKNLQLYIDKYINPKIEQINKYFSDEVGCFCEKGINYHKYEKKINGN